MVRAPPPANCHFKIRGRTQHTNIHSQPARTPPSTQKNNLSHTKPAPASQMAKMVTSTNGRPAAKRVISESSSEEDTPIAKRSKSDSKPALPTPNSEPPPTSSGLSSVDENELDDGKPAVDDDEEEEDDEMVHSSDVDDDDDKPIVNSNYKPTVAPKRSIDESSASTTLTTNTEVPTTQAIKLPKIKKNSQSPQKKIKPEPDLSSDDDQPLVSRQPGPATAPSTSNKRRASAKVKKEEESESDDAQPLIQRNTPKPKPTRNLRGAKKAAPKPVKSQPAKPKGKKAKKEEDDDDELGYQEETEAQAAERYKLSEHENNNGVKKWDKLQHNGVLFPPEYEPLPGHVKMKYNGKNVDLPPESEEVAYFFGSMLNSDHVQKATFRNNFFEDWLEVLKKHPPRDGTKITQFSKCDFTPMFDYAVAEREKNKKLTAEEKLKLRKKKNELEEKYRTCLLNGKKEKVGAFRVEPPGLFRGRGEHPKTGKLKKRVTAEDITINCGPESKVPEPPPGHEWAAVVHINTACWLACWNENINGNTKYVFLAAGSSLGSQSDFKKFEKARKLKDYIVGIRKDYTTKLKDRMMAVRQRATAMYLIDNFALRAGNEKSTEDEADTVGCCSLKIDHVTLEPPRTVTFDFLGKDSIRFFNKFEVDEAVFKNLAIFKKNKDHPSDKIFDRLTTGTLNKHLSSYMEGLTAKVFRTYNASVTFEKELAKNMRLLDPGATEKEKIVAYNQANRQVAVLCNHQKAVSKTHGASMEKCVDKIRAIKYRRRLERLSLLTHELDRKTRALYEVDESDIDEEWMEKHEESTETRKRDTIIKKYAKLEEELNAPPKEPKQEEEGKDKKPTAMEKALEKYRAMTVAERQEQKAAELASCDGVAEKMRTKRQKIEPKPKTPQDLIERIAVLDKEIQVAKTLLKDRDDGKETSLGTSKTNYIDPRLTFAWAGKYGIKPAKIFPKTLQEKFTWAEETPADWKF
ncbi:hypothetical protein PtA15_12A268 [Puccinia triticina]|uniref:DNA topoisomerase I n=1 Tax=Puccinia triticina TaxID=208348 RepID=A0ABY7CZ97_9BASI|nr:uncharacterized protein PtA15_12A268 [Puccinia triticina]WAQ90280.1 hypothetical protein PtA15_12A268 [Puccinia triticina]